MFRVYFVSKLVNSNFIRFSVLVSKKSFFSKHFSVCAVNRYSSWFWGKRVNFSREKVKPERKSRKKEKWPKSKERTLGRFYTVLGYTSRAVLLKVFERIKRADSISTDIRFLYKGKNKTLRNRTSWDNNYYKVVVLVYQHQQGCSANSYGFSGKT